jgi:hypothetical protein
MKVKCCFCLKILKEKGAIIFSPPDKPYTEFVDDVSKYHICEKCWDQKLRPYILEAFRSANQKKRAK